MLDMIVNIMEWNINQRSGNDNAIYKWDKDFRKYLGRDENGKSVVEKVPAGYPDHAILTAQFEI